MEEKLKKIDAEKDQICGKADEVKPAPKPKKHQPPPVPLTTSGTFTIHAPFYQFHKNRNDRVALNGPSIQFGEIQEMRQESLQRRHRRKAQMAKRRNLSH